MSSSRGPFFLYFQAPATQASSTLSNKVLKMHNMSKFDNITEKNNIHIYSIFKTETSRDPKGVKSLDCVATLARVAGVFVRERGTRVKDRGKTGASKIPFLVLSLLQNQIEKFATQANATRNPQLLLLLRTVGYIVLALK